MKIPGYQVHRKIGQGGMASVFLATQTSFERKVALKMIANSAFGTETLAERFEREAKIVASFSHPHIVPVYDVGRVDKYHYLAMDYLQGGDLSSWIRAGLEPQESEVILTQMAQALHYAHGKGYIHRDVKADNIMFREDNSAVLTDFGIARPVKAQTSHTEQGTVVGTPSYMSPEQCQGGEIDGRSDLYSLGVLLFIMLTKELPYTADEPLALALKHVNAPLPQLPTAHSRYQPLIDKLMAKHPDDRYQSGLELSKAVKALGEEINVNTAPITPAASTAADTSAAMTDSNLELVALEGSASKNKPYSGKSFDIEEQRYRKMGVISRYQLICHLQSENLQHFSVLYSQLTTRLVEWFHERDKRCGKLELNFHVDATMVERITELLNTLYEQGGPYTFLKKLDIEVAFIGPDGTEIKTMKLE